MHNDQQALASTRESILKRLAGIFVTTPRERLEQVLHQAKREEVREGQVLMREGGPPPGVYVLHQGKLGIYHQSGTAQMAAIAIANQTGELIGPENIQDGRHFSEITVLALTPAITSLIPAETFRELLEADPAAASQLAEKGRSQALQKLQALSLELTEATGQTATDIPIPRPFSTGAKIYAGGEDARSAFFVLSGRVDLFPKGCPVPHESIGPGLIFGENEVLGDTPRRFDAVAARATELLEIPAEILSLGQKKLSEVGTTMKTLAFVHNMPKFGSAYRYLAEADGQSCIVTDYIQAGGRRVRVRHFPQTERVEAGTAEAAAKTEAVVTPDGEASLLVTDCQKRLVGLSTSDGWPDLPEAMALLLRGGRLESWQIDALRSAGAWLEESATERAVEGSEVICACTNSTAVRLRAAGRKAQTVDELVQQTGAGAVCGGCRSRLPLMLGQGDGGVLCYLETKPLCSGAVRAILRPAGGNPLPPARPGQYVRVEALLDGRWVGRPYTLTGFGPEAYELGVKIEEEGLFSNWICQAAPHALVRVSAPQGEICPAAEETRPLIYLVAGIGVTTAVAAVRALGGRRPLKVYFVYRETKQAPYLEELREASAKKTIQLCEICTTRDGRPDAATWRMALSQHGPCEAIVCGPNNFNATVMETATSLTEVEAKAESFLHPQRGEGSVAQPGDWRIPNFTPTCPAHEQVTNKSKLPAVEEAEHFLRQYFREMPEGTDPDSRLAQVREEIEASGTWEQTAEELGFAVRIAWRNAERCVGRLYWQSLHLRDCRRLNTAKEIAEALFDHLRFAFNGGDLRPAISIFAPERPDRPAPRIWNPQLLRYAGLRLRTGKQIGDPAQNELTQRIIKLGWDPDGTDFNLLPLVIQYPGEDPQLFQLPDDCRHETSLAHPHHPWLADLGLRWHCIPAVSDMMLDAGGVDYRLAPFSGWYLNTEIAARNLTDTNRYNLLPTVAEAMGLDISKERTLWRDKAMVVLNEALLHSFDREGVKMSDHHSVGHEFLEFCRNEQKAGREPYGKWMWLVPPVSSSASILYQEPFKDVAVKPAFLYQKPIWREQL